MYTGVGMRCKVAWLICGISLFLLLTPALSEAGLTLKGRLLQPRATTEKGVVTFKLEVYDSEQGGSLLFAEEHKFAVTDKVISLVLGQGQILEGRPQAGLDPTKLWLEVNVDGQVMVPRLNLAEVDGHSELRSASGWKLAGAGLRGVSATTLTIAKDGISLDSVKAPLVIEATTIGGVISATNYGGFGYGVVGAVEQALSGGVYGKATADMSYGVVGSATASAAGTTNYGGMFTAMGETGYGVEGKATGKKGKGVYGEASDDSNVKNRGGYFLAKGVAGVGVYGEADHPGLNSDDGKNYGGYFTAAGMCGVGVYGEALEGRYLFPVFGGLFKTTGDNGTGVAGHSEGKYSHGVSGYSSGESGVGVSGISDGSKGIGVKGNGKLYCFYADGTGTDYGTFTGGHDVRLAPGEEDLVQPGMLVSLTGISARNPEITDGRPALSSTLPTVALTRKARDKAVFGVWVQDCPLPANHWYQETGEECFGVVNAVGEGCMWVCDAGGDIEAGDALVSSDVAGYGQKQQDDLIHTYTVGRATETVDWSSVEDFILVDGHKVKVRLLTVIYMGG